MLSTLFAVPLLQFIPLWVCVPLSILLGTIMWLSHWPGKKATPKSVRASHFRPDLVPADITTIVIGSGSGGCACANLLAQSGQKVLLLEQHYRTGGCTHTFREEVRHFRFFEIGTSLTYFFIS
jgi:hypothetical protein